MEKRTTIIVIILAIILSLSLIVLLRFYSESPPVETSCIEPKVNLTYNACYDMAKSSVSLKINNNENNLNDFMASNTLVGSNLYISPMNKHLFNRHLKYIVTFFYQYTSILEMYF